MSVKSGFISVIGRTNAGKSTLINALLGEKLALTSHKQNATRRKIRAIVMHGDTQLIFTDTPGLHNAQKKFNQMLVNSALDSLKECDVILFVASIFDEISEYENFLKIAAKVPHIVLLNKVDLAKNEQVLKKMSEYAKFSAKFSALLPFSCRQKSYKKPLLDEIAKLIPTHPYFYEPDLLSDSAEKMIYADFILEAIFENFSDEIPYSCEVMINLILEHNLKPLNFNKNSKKSSLNLSENLPKNSLNLAKFKDLKAQKMLEIKAQIITAKAQHKALLIGKNGAALKRLGICARRKIEKFSEKKVALNLSVSVKKSWFNDDDFLKKVIF